MSLKNLPEITFVDADPDKIRGEVKAVVEEYLGRQLSRADPVNLLLNAFSAVVIQLRLKIDQVAKQNLLAYATGDYLEHLGALCGIERLPAAKAVTTVEVTLSAERQRATVINQGTRITAGENVYFALDEDVIFAAGETVKTCAATCLTTGAAGNDYLPGELNQIVDPQPFLLSISNVTKSELGADVESDEHLRERIRTAPESFSVAGPEGAYIFHAKATSVLISDVAVDSERPTTVQVYVLLNDGVIPETEMLNAVYENLSAKSKRPLTDLLTVLAPTVQNFNVDVSFWINQEDDVQAAQIVEDAELAVAEFVAWQKAKLGRDINPSELIYRLKKIGVKRVLVREPVFRILDKFSVAIAENINVTFEGLEVE